MENTTGRDGLDRIVAVDENAAALEVLAERLPGSDLTTLLLEVARRRTAGLGPADVMRQYAGDRFVAPAPIDPIRLGRLTVRALELARPQFEPVTLAPLAPFGTHSVLGGVHQNNVVTTIRMTEVAADPTSSLALEAAVRRRQLLATEPKSAEAVHLAAVERVVRAQRFDDPLSFPHFSLFVLVSAGRDTGGRTFEAIALSAQLQAMADLASGTTGGRVKIRLTDFDGRFHDVLERVAEQIESRTIACEPWPERTAGRGYYPNVCFKLSVETDDDEIELGDGGAVEWTQRLLQSRKERLVIAGLSLERLALLAD